MKIRFLKPRKLPMRKEKELPNGEIVWTPFALRKISLDKTYREIEFNLNLLQEKVDYQYV